MAEQMKKRDIIIARNYHAGLNFVKQQGLSSNSIIIPANWPNSNIFLGMNGFNFYDIWIAVRWMEIHEDLRFLLRHKALMYNVKLEDALRFPIMKD